MELRDERAARLRRAARGRAGFVALALLLYAAAAVSAAWPAVLHAGSDFLAGGAPGHGEASAGHLLGPSSILLPLALLGIEQGTRGWLVVSVAALASIPLSGQVHLALGAIPFVCAYALVRRRRWTAAAGALAAIAAGLLVREVSIKGSVNAGGRSLGEVESYQARFSDFWTRHEAHGSESFVYLGWATPVLALAGLVVLWRSGRR